MEGANIHAVMEKMKKYSDVIGMCATLSDKIASLIMSVDDVLAREAVLFTAVFDIIRKTEVRVSSIVSMLEFIKYLYLGFLENAGYTALNAVLSDVEKHSGSGSRDISM